MNKDYIQPLDELQQARLRVLLDNINELYNSDGMMLENEVISLYYTAVNTFYDSLNKSVVGVAAEILTGSPADPNVYNEILLAIKQDLAATYNELAVLDRMVSASFNSISITKEEINQRSKRIANKLGDYLLYADPLLGAGYFFSDSFNSADKLDINSSLIEEEVCYHNSEEGIILLPLDGNPSRPEIKEIIINSSSNGKVGNNHQIDVFGHKAIEAISDNKANTWFEYEKVTTVELSEPLILDLTFVLSESSIINNITINPLFFGTPTPVKVIDIKTSKDGNEYVSVKDEVPIKDFVSEDEDNVFALSAASANYSGKGIYSFLPRRAKYIHIILNQTTPYAIDTINGSRLRYAIGIRDIEILSRKFKTSGSIVSTSFSALNNVKKISMWASENPVESSALADISHYITYDNGGSWKQIQPQGRTDSNIPEILNFNIAADDSIQTDEEVLSFRHKISMTRDPEAFSGNFLIKEEEIQNLDIVGVPNPSDPKVSLTQKPIKESISIVMPYMGSFSCPREKYGSTILDESTPMNLDFVEFVVDVPGAVSGVDPNGDPQQEGTIRYTLPYTNIPYLSEKIRVFINGAQIEYRPKDDYFFDNPAEFIPNPINITESSKVYYLNKGGTELQFGYKQKTGNGAGYQRGFVPSTGSRIQVCLDGDNPQLELSDNGFVVKLLASTDGDKETVSIVALKTLEEDSAIQYEIEIPTGERIFQAPIMKDNGIGEYLNNDENNSQDSFKIPLFLEGTANFIIKEYDLEGNLITGSRRQFTDPEDFVNGRYELQSFFGDELANKYTFDASTGTVYLGTEAKANRKTVLVCNKIEAEKINPDSWEYEVSSSGAINPQNIVLNPEAVYTFKQSTKYNIGSETSRSIQLISGNTKSHSWFNKMVVKGTVKPDLSLFDNNVKPTEVDYIDGNIEFSNEILIEKEPITFTYVDNLSGSINLYSFSLSKPNLIKQFIGTPAFSTIRSIDSVTTYTNRFDLDGQVSTVNDISSAGEWSVVINPSTGVVTITIAANSGILSESYAVTYRINDTDTGLDQEGLYSVDYFNGIIYFSNPIAATGNISYEISIYSCFYNIGKLISSNNIEEIKEEEKTLKFKTSFAMRFLKQNTPEESRPQVIKILYNYYKTISESLADLEPYFSPICKHIGIRAVTSNVLEEL